MAIYLVQHGISLPKTEDPDPGLSPEGAADAQRIASVANSYHVNVHRIFHSGKKRARQTAEIFEQALTPAGGMEAISGLKPMDDPLLLARQLDPASDTLYVGHLPFLSSLVSYLITGSVDTPVFQLQNAGLLCLDRLPDNGPWVICWGLMPKLISWSG